MQLIHGRCDLHLIHARCGMQLIYARCGMQLIHARCGMQLIHARCGMQLIVCRDVNSICFLGCLRIFNHKHHTVHLYGPCDVCFCTMLSLICQLLCHSTKCYKH